MKKLVSRTLIFAMVLGFGLAALATAEDGTWTGWVTETHCGAAGAKAAHADCAVKCVKEKGAHWALYNPTDKSIFVLSGDDAMMEKWPPRKSRSRATWTRKRRRSRSPPWRRCPPRRCNSPRITERAPDASGLFFGIRSRAVGEGGCGGWTRRMSRPSIAPRSTTLGTPLRPSSIRRVVRKATHRDHDEAYPDRTSAP